MRTVCAAAVFLVLSVCLFGESTAGTLDDFEDDATKKSESDTTDTTRSGSSEDSSFMESCASGCLESAGEALFRALWSGGSSSMSRMETPDSADSTSVQSQGVSPGTPLVKPRELGDFQLPVLQLGIRYEKAESDVSAFDGLLEGGYGPFGVDLRYTHYVEDSPPDELDVLQWHALLRMAAADEFEIDVGYGTLTLSGNSSTTGSSVTVPVRVTPEAPVAFVFRPTWSWLGDNTISEYDAGLHYVWPYFSASIGYRWLISDESSLNGAFIGVSARL